MLQKFNVFIKGDLEELYLFQLSLERMENNRKAFKKDFNYFKGMRDSWFPLVLLEKVTSFGSVEYKHQVCDTFNILMGYPEFQSYYVDKYEKKGDVIKIRMRGRSPEILEEMLRRVMSFYNLNCSYRIVN